MGCLLESSWFTNCFVRGSDACFFSLSHYDVVLTSLSFQHPVVILKVTVLSTSTVHFSSQGGFIRDLAEERGAVAGPSHQGAPRCMCIAWSQSEKKNVTLEALPGWSSAGWSYWYYKMSETATLHPLYIVDSNDRSLWCRQATSGANHRGRRLCRRLDNLNERDEINSITYELQKQALVLLGVTISLFPHTFPVVQAWVHLHGYITRRAVLLSSLPFLRCLTSFCQTALLRSFSSSGQMDIMWLS